MKIKFDSSQKYQIDAVNAVADIFVGQSADGGGLEREMEGNGRQLFGGAFVAGNNLTLTEEEIARNVHAIQERNKLEKSEIYAPFEDKNVWSEDNKPWRALKDGMHFTVEMETGTGKTYVYLRTIHELHKRYGFKKFIIVVPSIAIKEGVVKNLEITREHFASLYDRPKADVSVYDPKKRGMLRRFATADSLQIVVINIDSFAKQSRERKKGNIIYQDSDWGVPIEFIRAVRPIVIVDEPQNMETDIRRQALANLSPLCTLRYSATHKYHYNLMYRLDPVKAYDLGLVKKIEVDSVLEENNQNAPYIELVAVSSQKTSIQARLKIDADGKDGVRRKPVTVRKSVRGRSESDLFTLSGGRETYRGYAVDAIDVAEQSVTFANGKTLRVGESWGGMGDEVTRLQIRRTIINHFEKEKRLRGKGVKVLSLFFIDKVANYREYAEGGSVKGKMARWFEEIFEEVKNLPAFSGLISYQAHDAHNGYFSRDKKGSWKDTKGDSALDDDTYALIMRDKERLLSMDEPLRFIFSHSALREGWDNPNVFQICTLNESQSEIKKRQEIGRGLRLPVDSEGRRVFDENVNVLTVIAHERFEDFARKLQTEIEEECGVPFGGRVKDKRKEVKVRLTKAYALNEDFKALWERIKHKTRYRVAYETEEVVRRAGERLSRAEIVAPKVVSLKARLNITSDGIATGLANVSEAGVEYDALAHQVPDILGAIQKRTKLTKDAIFGIIRRSGKGKTAAENPQRFVDAASEAISETLQELMLEGIKYERFEGEASYYAMELFKEEGDGELKRYLDNVVKVEKKEKTLYTHVLTDSDIEERFAKDLETMEQVKFYFKLPGWFKIKTPIGAYNPDWAVVLENDEKVYFVAETKPGGEIRGSESAKVACGRKHFEQLEGVRFERVETARELF